MNATPERIPSLSERLDGINMSDLDRIVARAYVERGEFIAGLVMGAARAVKAFARSVARGVTGLFRQRQLS